MFIKVETFFKKSIIIVNTDKIIKVKRIFDVDDEKRFLIVTNKGDIQINETEYEKLIEKLEKI